MLFFFFFFIIKFLTQYEAFMQRPNFTEAALLIVCAAQIYGRKVDHLEDLILSMCKGNSSEEKAR